MDPRSASAQAWGAHAAAPVQRHRPECTRRVSPNVEMSAALARTEIMEVPINRDEDERVHRELELTWMRRKGLVGWLSTTNHKDIALRYIVTAFTFFAVAGLLAAAMRIQLALPKNTFL